MTVIFHPFFGIFIFKKHEPLIWYVTCFDKIYTVTHELLGYGKNWRKQTPQNIYPIGQETVTDMF